MDKFLGSASFKQALSRLYGPEDKAIKRNLTRYQNLVSKFLKRFSSGPIQLFSTPGRTEIGGNHTDHNHGQVLAAAVNLDSIAAVSKVPGNMVTVYSEGYNEPFQVNLDDLENKEGEAESSTALIRGILSRFQQIGCQVGGFQAYISSEVLPGSGLSSSASFEILIATIVNLLFNEGQVPSEELALIGQFAENVYFKKPCGLMDQLACCVGGFINIDFKNPKEPLVQKVDFDFNSKDYSLIVLHTGGTHSDLTSDYAAVPEEMKTVARFLGKKVCREISFEEVMGRINELRKISGDRSILRAMHFIQEHQRVGLQVKALEQNNFTQFLRLINESGKSSCCWLQNCFTTKNSKEQGVMLGLYLSENYIKDIGEGACRVHGGGFAGTLQVFLPNNRVGGYIKMTEPVFGSQSATILKIRSLGTCQVLF
jgi:galactokinase